VWAFACGILRDAHCFTLHRFPVRVSFLGDCTDIRLDTDCGQLFVVQTRREIEIVLEINRFLYSSSVFGAHGLRIISRIHLLHYATTEGIIKSRFKTLTANGSSHG